MTNYNEQMFDLLGIHGTPELWTKEEQKLLEGLAPEVMKDYGEDYIHNLKMFLTYIPSISSPDFSPMLCDVLHALLAERPRGLYTPGKNAYKYLLMFCYFPLGFYDFCMGRIMSSPSVPKALRATETQKQNWEQVLGNAHLSKN